MAALEEPPPGRQPFPGAQVPPARHVLRGWGLCFPSTDSLWTLVLSTGSAQGTWKGTFPGVSCPL